MASREMTDLAGKMKGIDFCMLSTEAEGGGITARPMSNNGEVEYDGDAWFFTYDHSDKVRQIGANPHVSTAYQGRGEGGAPGAFVSVEGTAEVITDRAVLEEHWYEGLTRWFPDGLDTEGIAIIKVHAETIRWWDGEEAGEIEAR